MIDNPILLFEDNFDGEDLDLTKWERCPEWKRGRGACVWDPKYSCLDGKGHLILRAAYEADGLVHSGGVRTTSTFWGGYGYYEASICFPTAVGTWGAFWMMCGDVFKVDGSAVSGVEVDVIESGECARRGVNHALHWDGYKPGQHKSVSHVIPNVPELYEGWHVYGCQWTKTDYVFFIDGRETWRTSEPGICERPGYMKLTTEFGSWAAPVVPEELPDFCRVDWVRAWAPATL